MYLNNKATADAVALLLNFMFTYCLFGSSSP